MTFPMTPAERIEARNNEIRTRATSTQTHACYWQSSSDGHEGCEVTNYTVAMILTYGSDKAHRIRFAEHSVEPGKMYAPAGPPCGSKRAGLNWVSAGKIVDAVTCGRC